MKKPTFQAAVEAVLEQSYIPLPKDKELKARYLTRVASDPLSGSDIAKTRASVERLVGCQIKSWDEPGFQDWFFNRDEFRQKTEYLGMLALDALQDILLNQDPKAQGARVQAIKVAMEIAGKTQKAQNNIQINTQIGGQIANMETKELEAYLRKSTALLGEQSLLLNKPIDIDQEEV